MSEENSQQFARVPDISVVIPTYRRPHQLAEALNSVFATTTLDIEVIVVDDCPDGSARDVVQRMNSDAVRYLRNPHPTGGNPSVVRNLGWPLAKGRFVHFLDDDDIVPEGHYARAVQALTQNPNVGVVFGRVAPFGDVDLKHETEYFDTAYRRARLLSYFGNRIAYSAWLTFSNAFIACSSAMVRRSCLAPLKGFDENVRLVEDVDFLSRAIRRYGAIRLDEVSIHYRIGPSLMHNNDDKAEALKHAYGVMHRRYRQEWGQVNFLSMKAAAVALRTFARPVIGRQAA